ncbi:MAG: hypothetical protein ACTHOU_15335 [Aureliella sp.]
MNMQILRRRIFYIAAMVLLLLPIYVLGQPSVRSADGSKVSPGGALAKIRSQYELGQADLGAIDPASESMRLATLGLRGVAVSILWQKAEYYKREQFWDNYSATLNQITKLEPHFVKVWDFLSWNLSYNISVEFDDYRQRYAWVKKGIDYLLTGTKYNRRKTDLPYELGWKFGNKLGVSDEKVQFRQLYRMDSDWHDHLLANGMDVRQQEGLGPDNYPDSWLTGRLWYERCYDMVNNGSIPCKGPTNFYRMGPMWSINFAQTIETEGHLGYPAEIAWRKAGEGWDWFGNKTMRSTWGEDLRMNDIEAANQALARAKDEFMEFCKEKADELRQKRYDALTEEEKAVLAIPDLDRTANQVYEAMRAEANLEVPVREIAQAMPADKQFRANELAIKVDQAKDYVSHVDIYRNQVNYSYWQTRCAAEQTDEALAARADLFEANKLLDRGALDEAIARYESAWKNWNALFNRFPSMMTDDSADEVSNAIKRYKQLIDKEQLPSDFVLNDFLRFREEFGATDADPRITEVLAEWSNNPNRGAYFDRIKQLRDAEAAQSETKAALPDEGQAPAPRPADKPASDAKSQPTKEPKPAEESKPAHEPKAAEESKPAEKSEAAESAVRAAAPEAGSPPAPAGK